MNERQIKINKIIQNIVKNEKEELVDYYGVKIFVYKNIDAYLEQLSDIKDKIYLAQWCNNFSKVQELINSLTLTDYQKNKYFILKSKNDEIDETINFRILDEKYSFLDNIMDMLTTDIDIQDRILSLSDSRLKLFKKMYYRLQQMTDYYNPYITSILQTIGYVTSDLNEKNRVNNYEGLLLDIEKAINNDLELSDNDIDIMLYLCTSSIRYNVPNLNEMKNFGKEGTLDFIETQKGIERAKDENNLNDLKFYILSTAYGIGLKKAQEICKKFNINNIEITNENKDTLEMYLAIYQIVNENDPFVLKELYDQFVKIMNPQKDFRRIVVFENDLRKAFASDLNRQVFKVDGKNFSLIDNVKIYDAGVDFKMIVTAIGSYQGNFEDKENYFNYWNSPKIRSHGNCCSLIGNSNLSMATVKNVIFGFSTMSDNMLLLSGISDINSTPDSKDFNTTKNKAQKYMNANDMLNNTRSDYNELVYERRDLSSNPKYYKKNPDYIVFIEEYENFEEWVNKFKDNPKQLEYLQRQKQEQERQWNESLKAAKNFGIPIVKINREKVARSEYNKVNILVEQFISTLDPILLPNIINTFENSRVGNCGTHIPIRERYFSPTGMSIILEKIKSAINKVDDDYQRNNLHFCLYKALIEERNKVKSCKYGKRNKGQTPGINFEKEISELEQVLTNNNVDDLIVGRTK